MDWAPPGSAYTVLEGRWATWMATSAANTGTWVNSSRFQENIGALADTVDHTGDYAECAYIIFICVLEQLS